MSRKQANRTKRRKDRQAAAFAEYRKQYPGSPFMVVDHLPARAKQVMIERYEEGWARRPSQEEKRL
jgi:hypothetical protein